MRIERPRSAQSFVWILAASLLVVALPSAMSAADPCVLPEGPPGTVTLPPDGCEYLSPDEVHMILDTLPPGTTIELAAIHKDFICRGAAGGPPPTCSAAQSHRSNANLRNWKRICK